jgi:hypothetical protein
MTVVLQAERWIVRNDPAVVHDEAVWVIGFGPEGATTVGWASPLVQGVAVLPQGGLSLECLREALRALPVNHAHSISVVNPAGSMAVVAADDGEQLWIGLRARDLGAYVEIEVLCCPGLISSCERQEQMKMRQAPLLKLDDVDNTKGFTKYSSLHEIVDEHILPLVKDSCHNVGAVTCSLTCNMMYARQIFLLAISSMT